jgi:glucokinase
VTDVVGALDIGGTHVSAGRIRVAPPTVERRVREHLPGGASRTDLLARIAGTARTVASLTMRELGVAVPGPFDYEAGVSAIRHKLTALCGVDLRAELASTLGLEPRAVVFLNDAAAFVLGEWWAGAAQGHARVVGITLGTGLGSAFLEEGEFVRSGAGVPEGGELYTLDFRGGLVEETISRGAVLERYGSDPDTGPDVDSIAALARAGDGRALRVLQQLAADLAEFLDPHLRAFGAGCLVVGGSIAQAWDLLGPGLEAGVSSTRPLAVTRARHLEDAALLGAARYAAASAAQ